MKSLFIMSAVHYMTLATFISLQKEAYDLLEMFLNSEYDPGRTEMDQLSDCENNVKAIAKHRFLSAQVNWYVNTLQYVVLAICVYFLVAFIVLPICGK